MSTCLCYMYNEIVTVTKMSFFLSKRVFVCVCVPVQVCTV